MGKKVEHEMDGGTMQGSRGLRGTKAVGGRVWQCTCTLQEVQMMTRCSSLL